MRRSLRGLRIVVTRAVHQAEELAGPLRELGAEPLLLPLIGIAPPDDRAPLIAAAEAAAGFDWIIFTSANAVTSFIAELPESGEYFPPRIAAIGPATAEVAEAYGLRVDLCPEKFIAEALAEAFRPFPLDGKRILIPCAAGARDVVPNELRKRGADVQVVHAYQNVIPFDAPEKAKAIFAEPFPDWVTFASSSAVTHLLALVPLETVAESKIATIGPATSSTATAAGLTVTSEAREHTVPGLIEAMRHY